jgi:hypothetical protein
MHTYNLTFTHGRSAVTAATIEAEDKNQAVSALEADYPGQVVVLHSIDTVAAPTPRYRITDGVTGDVAEGTAREVCASVRAWLPNYTSTVYHMVDALEAQLIDGGEVTAQAKALQLTVERI